MDRPPHPWREYEERELLCNIIRASNVNPIDVYNFIAQHRINPSWDYVFLPADRPIAECRGRFDNYYTRAPYPTQPTPFAAPQYQLPTSSFGGPSRIRQSYDPQTSGGRVLLPKTAPSTPSEAGPAYPQSPLADQPAARKRGRPPKEEVSRRRAEAEARGEIYPAPRSKRAKRPAQPQDESSPSQLASPYHANAPAPMISTPMGAAPQETESESSGSKKRRLQRPADIETTGSRIMRDPASGSYESPPQTSLTQGQPSASTTSGTHDIDTRMEGVEDPAPSSRAQSYREIVGIRGSAPQ